MKSIKKIVVIFFALLLQVPISLKAQLDTVHFSNEHINQYIYPPMIDPIGYPSREVNIYDLQGLLLNNLMDNQFNRICSIAQRYEVNEGDSATINGVAFAHSNNNPYNLDTIKISIWDKYLATELYTQYFLNLVDITTLTEEMQPYIECIFNDTITLYEDYYVSISTFELTDDLGTIYPSANVPFLFFEEYALSYQRLQEGFIVPYGVSTKYRPYVQFSGEPNARGWIHVDDVEWLDSYFSYEDVARYDHFLRDMYAGDTTVYAPLGICPIMFVEDTTNSDTTSGLTSVFLSEESVELYPNPVKDELNISCDYNILEIEVFDALNRLVYEQKSNSKNIKLNVSTYKSGTYILSIKTDKGKIDKKFIVN
jgi:hypothetical protein